MRSFCFQEGLDDSKIAVNLHFQDLAVDIQRDSNEPKQLLELVGLNDMTIGLIESEHPTLLLSNFCGRERIHFPSHRPFDSIVQMV